MNKLVMDSTHTTFLISRRTTFRKGVPRLTYIQIKTSQIYQLNICDFCIEVDVNYIYSKFFKEN